MQGTYLRMGGQRSAVEVDHLRRGQRPFKVVRPKMNGHSSEVPREGVDDLTLRAEEFDTLKARINVDHIACPSIDPGTRSFMNELTI